MNKIFLSHSHAGSQLAKLVCQSLTAAGDEVLLAERGTVETGPQRGRHRELLGACDLCMVLLMPGEAESDCWVGYEIAMAASATKRAVVVPIGAAMRELDAIPADLVEFWSLTAADTGYRFVHLQRPETAVAAARAPVRQVA